MATVLKLGGCGPRYDWFSVFLGVTLCGEMNFGRVYEVGVVTGGLPDLDIVYIVGGQVKRDESTLLY